MLTLRGATMGVIGLGGIGQEVARLSRAAGMRVIGTRRSATAPLPDADGADLVLPAMRILEVAAESDFLVVCSQLTAETHGFINASVFAAMKPDAVLINVARGEEVDEDALVEAVTAGRIRGAVLDVYAGELAGRPPRPELTGLPQILLTPHISASGDDQSWPSPSGGSSPRTSGGTWTASPSSTWSTAPAVTSAPADEQRRAQACGHFSMVSAGHVCWQVPAARRLTDPRTVVRHALLEEHASAVTRECPVARLR